MFCNGYRGAIFAIETMPCMGLEEAVARSKNIKQVRPLDETEL